MKTLDPRRAYRVSDDLPGGSLRSPCCVAIDPKGRGVVVSEAVSIRAVFDSDKWVQLVGHSRPCL